MKLQYDLKTLLKLYTVAMTTGVRTPVPHAFGPPGTGKSSIAQAAADMLGVKLHVINVSRISPLELEGVQMPDKEHAQLNLLTATFWTQLKEGDILLLDEFLRGFPEVYNGLLDILTSRNVAGFELPNVFIMAASNTTVAYDPALEDRLLHIPVPDIRSMKGARSALAKVIAQEAGLHPDIANYQSMEDLLTEVIAKSYDILDTLKGKRNQAVTASPGKSFSARHAVGLILMRQWSTDPYLTTLVDDSNKLTLRHNMYQYFLYDGGKTLPTSTIHRMEDIVKGGKAAPLQQRNLAVNLQLAQLRAAEEEVNSMEGEEYDDIFA